MSYTPFSDRRQAGRRLVDKLTGYADRPEVIVLGLPRGGVPVAFEVAKCLHAVLDVFIVRKIGVPGHPELAMGAIASGGVIHLNESIISRLYIPRRTIDSVIEEETLELKRREKLYRSGRAPLDLSNRFVILVDDGLATGATMLAAIRAVRDRDPREIVVAVPVAASSSIGEVQRAADKLVFILAPRDFYAVGEWYDSFEQTTDREVTDLLSQARKWPSAA